MEYLHTGVVPDITDADMYNSLVGQSHDGYVMIPPNGSIWMVDIALKWALDLVGENTGLFSAVHLTQNFGFGEPQLVPRDEWGMYFKRAKEEVLDKGGLVVARVLKYGIKPGTSGHFMIISSIDDNDKLLIVDSVGPDKQGSASWAYMADYAEPVAEFNDKGQRFRDAGKPSFIWMAGVIPTF